MRLAVGLAVLRFRNGDGTVDDAEVESFETEVALLHLGPTFAFGIIAVTTYDSPWMWQFEGDLLWVWQLSLELYRSLGARLCACACAFARMKACSCRQLLVYIWRICYR